MIPVFVKKGYRKTIWTRGLIWMAIKDSFGNLFMSERTLKPVSCFWSKNFLDQKVWKNIPETFVAKEIRVIVIGNFLYVFHSCKRFACGANQLMNMVFGDPELGI